MSVKMKFNPKIYQTKLSQEQAVLTCSCYSVSRRLQSPAVDRKPEELFACRRFPDNPTQKNVFSNYYYEDSLASS